MSDITGKGYGDKHNWIDKGTEQNYHPASRSTLFSCKDCDAAFRHYYHLTPDIHQAMRECGIKEECKDMSTIRYISHSITESTHVETKEVFYELSYWYVSDKKPDIAGRKHVGYFKSYKEAEEKHNKNLVEGLL